MDLPDLKYREGETLQLGFVGDEDAETVTIIVKTSASAPTTSIIETDNFIDGEAFIDTPVDINEGDYIYQVTYVYEDGTVEKYPDATGCEDDQCDFPAFTVCPALDPGVS